MNDPNALWKDLLPYRSNLMLNSNQGLALFRQTQIISRHKYLHKHNNEIFLKYLNNALLHFTNNKFPLPKEILTTLVFKSSNQTQP